MFGSKYNRARCHSRNHDCCASRTETSCPHAGHKARLVHSFTRSVGNSRSLPAQSCRPSVFSMKNYQSLSIRNSLCAFIPFTPVTWRAQGFNIGSGTGPHTVPVDPVEQDRSVYCGALVPCHPLAHRLTGLSRAQWDLSRPKVFNDEATNWEN
jgi:hypothetical protein